MTQTTARVTRQGKHYEILVDLDEALKIKKGQGNLNSAVLTESVFHNLKSGEHVSSGDLIKNFGTDVFEEVALKIIKGGEIVLPSDYFKKESEQKYKQIIDFLTKNAVSPEGRPYTSDRIMKALKEANVVVKNTSIDSQIKEITDELAKILPIRLEMRKIKITVPAQHTGKAYGLLKESMKEENWMQNGDLQAVLVMPVGMVFDFYDKLNAITHGSALAEEMKE